MAILSKGCKPDDFQSHNSLKQKLALHTSEAFAQILLNVDILALCETNLDDSTDSGNFSVRGYLRIHGLGLYMKEGLPFARDLSLGNSADSYCGFLCFRLALLHSASYFFFLHQSHSSSLCMVFDSISSNIDEVLSINSFANVFFFGDFNVHHKDC